MKTKAPKKPAPQKRKRKLGDPEQFERSSGVLLQYAAPLTVENAIEPPPFGLPSGGRIKRTAEAEVTLGGAG